MTSDEPRSSNPQERFSYLADLRAYDEQLEFAARVIDSSPIPKPERLELYQDIDCIQKRRGDSKFYLAVIGEVSSGKSTFINALLGHDLLKSSALVATATATKLLQGNAIAVEVLFKNPQQRPVKVNYKNKVKVNLETGEVTVAWLPWGDRLNIKQFIHEVTSNDTLARKVAGVTITHPALFLSSGVVIIDTPGANTENLEHREITCQVVEQSADAVIITVPATQPLSNTLIEFLAQELHPFLHRCVFLVTKMDLIQPEQQSQLIENIKVRLHKDLGIIQPTVFACAPQIVLDDLNGEEIPSQLEEWKTKFFELEAALKKRLHQERALSITESGLRLLTRLFDRIDTHLQLQWQQYRVRQEALARHAVPDLVEFAAQQAAICSDLLDAAISTAQTAIAQSVEAHRKSTLSRIRDRIWNAPDVKALEFILETKAHEILNEEQQVLQKSVQKNLETLEIVALNAGRYFDYQFSEAYRRLQVIGGRTEFGTHSANVGVSLNASQAVASVQSFYQEIVDRNFNLSIGGGGAGAVAGGAIGSFMLPVIGTAIGSGIGGTIGLLVANFFSPAFEERKEQLWENLHSSLNNYFDTAKKHALQAAREYGQNVMHPLSQRRDAYVARYKIVVEAMQSEQKKELLRLTMLQEQTEATLQEIELRRKFMSAQLQGLSEITV